MLKGMIVKDCLAPGSIGRHYNLIHFTNLILEVKEQSSCQATVAFSTAGDSFEAI